MLYSVHLSEEWACSPETAAVVFVLVGVDGDTLLWQIGVEEQDLRGSNLGEDLAHNSAPEQTENNFIGCQNCLIYSTLHQKLYRTLAELGKLTEFFRVTSSLDRVHSVLPDYLKDCPLKGSK